MNTQWNMTKNYSKIKQFTCFSKMPYLPATYRNRSLQTNNIFEYSVEKKHNFMSPTNKPNTPPAVLSVTSNCLSKFKQKKNHSTIIQRTQLSLRLENLKRLTNMTKLTITIKHFEVLFALYNFLFNVFSFFIFSFYVTMSSTFHQYHQSIDFINILLLLFL